jgi:EKC/KEOPS complex subunit CGI121/TPRKB
MAALQTITLEHIPAMRDVHVALFRNLRNAAALQANLLRRDPEFEYAFIDASAVCF